MKVVAILSVFVLIGGMITFSQNADFSASSGPIKPCEEPLTYNFGDIDSRFDITQKELTEIMTEVEEIWATALNKDLLDYDKNGLVTIHLIYSEDQKRTEDERAFSQRIEQKRSRLEILKQEYNQHSERFNEQKTGFQSTVDEYNQLIEDYNNYAQKWDGKKIPVHAQNRFKRMEQNINRIKAEVNRKQQDLETLRQQTNAKSKALNELVEKQNELVADYNARFSVAKKFDQGRYIKQGEQERINIFQFANLAELRTVLTHESGHAFGLGHVSNPESIMNEMMAEQNIFNLQLTDEDIASIKNLCSN